MSNISLISAIYENVANIRLDQDIVVSVDLTDVLHNEIASEKVDISRGDVAVKLQNHTVNDVNITGESDGRKVIFMLPEQAEGMSRHFMVRLDHPKQCAYDFIESNNASVAIQSNFGKLLSVDESMTSSVTMLDCYEVA